MKVEQLLKNKYVLYAVLFVAISHVLGYLTIRNYRALTLFIAIGLLTTHFTKNMTITLLSAIVFTGMFATSSLLEGNTTKEHAKKEDEDKDMVHEGKESMESKEKKDDKKEKESMKAKKDDKDCPDGKCGGEKNHKEKFSQQNVPSSTPAAASESVEDEEIGKRIDYAATLENAYDNLQGILGAKGMDGLTKETQKLISQQSSLMKTLNTMTPVLNNAKSTLDNFDLGSITESLGSLQSMMGGKQPTQK